jgi:hypothetical protein
MRSHDEGSKILMKIEELTKSLNKGPKIWNGHLAKVGGIFCLENAGSGFLQNTGTCKF